MKRLILSVIVLFSSKFIHGQILVSELKPIVDSLLNRITQTGKVRVLIAPIQDLSFSSIQKSNVTDAITEIVSNFRNKQNSFVAIPPSDIETIGSVKESYSALSIRLAKLQKQDFLIGTILTPLEKVCMVKLQLYDKSGELFSFLSKSIVYNDEIKKETFVLQPIGRLLADPKPNGNSFADQLEGTQNNTSKEKSTKVTIPQEEPLPKMPPDCGRSEFGLLVLTNNSKLRLVIELKRQTNPFNWSPEDRRFINLNSGEKTIERCRNGNWSISVYDRQPNAWDNPFNVMNVSILACEFTTKSINFP